MSISLSAPTSHSLFQTIFNSALDAYKKQTNQDLSSHPLLPVLQSCDSADAILTVLRAQIPRFGQTQIGNEALSKWLIPTVNVLNALSATLGEGIGLVFSPAKVIFAGIGVLLLAAKDVNSSQDKLVDLFNRIGYFFQRLEIYTGVSPTTTMADIFVEIMVEVLAILAIATKEMNRGLLKQCSRKLIGNTEVEDALERLDKLTREEARMGSAELVKITHGVDKRIQHVGGDVQRVGNMAQIIDDRVKCVGNNVEHFTSTVQGMDGRLDQINRNQLRDSLLRWLSPSDPSANHKIARKVHHKNTAQWFFQGSIFNRWKSDGCLLWLHGKPGSGKTILCSSIIQDITTSRDAGRAFLAYFYFDFRDLNKQKLQDLLPSLLIQLSSRSQICCDILFKLYSDHDCGVDNPSDGAMIDCLNEMLSVETQVPKYIIIDALDECPLTSCVPSPREEVLDFVDELVGLRLPNVHICVTSRPELDIRAVLEPLTSHPVSLHDESGQKRDIAEYVSSFVHLDRRMRRWREEDKVLVIKTLTEKADGMFRWAFCQLEVLRYCFPPSVRRVLAELPDSLDETYERILKEIRKPNQGHAYRLLQCLVAAARPLRVEELAEVLAFDFDADGIPKLNPDWRWEDQEEAVMSACSSLVIVVRSRGLRIAQFSHSSVKEYLTSNHLLESRKDVSHYHISLEDAHTTLAQACLGVLFRLDEHIDRDKVKSFPLARYAARYWVKHVQFENVSSHVKGGMRRLFDRDKPHFAAWLWIYHEKLSHEFIVTRPSKPDAVPLYYASFHGFYDLVEHLIVKYPEDITAVGGVYSTPLHAAAVQGHAEVASLLLKHLPVDLKARFENRTPLHNAAHEGRLEIGRLLLNHGADVNARQHNGQTPLYLSVMFRHPSFIRLLLDHGADAHARDNNGGTPYDLMKYERWLEGLKIFTAYGVDSDSEASRVA